WSRPAGKPERRTSGRAERSPASLLIARLRGKELARCKLAAIAPASSNQIAHTVKHMIQDGQQAFFQLTSERLAEPRRLSACSRCLETCARRLETWPGRLHIWPRNIPRRLHFGARYLHICPRRELRVRSWRKLRIRARRRLWTRRSRALPWGEIGCRRVAARCRSDR